MSIQLYIILILVIFISILLLHFYVNINESFTSNRLHRIPKIIHQTAPADESKWPLTWHKCQDSWKRHFPEPEYRHIMWHDEDLDLFVKKNYGWFYPIYINYDKKIKRIDIARYMILHKYGGIYADMDYYCNKNFYNQLENNKINIVESPYKYNEHLQNSLMASIPQNKLWIEILRKAISRKNIPHPNTSTGPRLLSSVYLTNRDKIHVLDYNYYNPKLKDPNFNSDKIYTKHYLTSVWASQGYGKNRRDRLFSQ